MEGHLTIYCNAVCTYGENLVAAACAAIRATSAAAVTAGAAGEAENVADAAPLHRGHQRPGTTEGLNFKTSSK